MSSVTHGQHLNCKHSSYQVFMCCTPNITRQWSWVSECDLSECACITKNHAAWVEVNFFSKLLLSQGKKLWEMTLNAEHMTAWCFLHLIDLERAYQIHLWHTLSSWSWKGHFNFVEKQGLSISWTESRFQGAEGWESPDSLVIWSFIFTNSGRLKLIFFRHVSRKRKTHLSKNMF